MFDKIIKQTKEKEKVEKLKSLLKNLKSREEIELFYSVYVDCDMDDENLKILASLGEKQKMNEFVFAWEKGMDEENLKRLANFNCVHMMEAYSNTWINTKDNDILKLLCEIKYVDTFFKVYEAIQLFMDKENLKKLVEMDSIEKMDDFINEWKKNNPIDKEFINIVLE